MRMNRRPACRKIHRTGQRHVRREQEVQRFSFQTWRLGLSRGWKSAPTHRQPVTKEQKERKEKEKKNTKYERLGDTYRLSVKMVDCSRRAPFQKNFFNVAENVERVPIALDKEIQLPNCPFCQQFLSDSLSFSTLSCRSCRCGRYDRLV